MKERDYQKLARKLIEQLQTVESLAVLARRQLESIAERKRKDRKIDDVRAVQSDLEDAERLLAVTAQDVADLE